jgi:hypothetical protein
MIGRTLGQHRIFERLGEGGMEGCMAEDLKFGRNSAPNGRCQVLRNLIS